MQYVKNIYKLYKNDLKKILFIIIILVTAEKINFVLLDVRIVALLFLEYYI